MTLKKLVPCGAFGSRFRDCAWPFSERGDLRRQLRSGAGSCGRGRSRTARSRRTAAGVRQRSRSKEGRARKVHTEFRRHRLDAHVGRIGADDDSPRPGPVLRRHGAQEERGRHGHDELRRHVSGHNPLCDHHLQSRLHAGFGIHRRNEQSLPAGHPERHLDRHRHAEWSGGDDPCRPSTSASR